MSRRELAKDEGQWRSFVRKYEGRAAALGLRAMMIVPYGEALIHPWYWQGLAQISGLAETDAVGAQTNLSFPIEKSLALFAESGGKIGKLRLWATFHPEMATVQDFAGRCRQLAEAGVRLCAGSVGVPENLALLRRLKAELPREIYLWVNKMDGLKRPYTREEKEAFLEIDPYFNRELTPVPADVAGCRERLFAEADGRLHTCNISQKLGIGWEDICGEGVPAALPEPKCGRKSCSCYLAYGGRDDLMNWLLFGDYPLFRIPRRPKAVFLDIEGTLLPKQDKQGKALRPEAAEIAPAVKAGLEAIVRDGTRLFFATTLPYEHAMKRCGKIRRLFQGGVFAGGAHLLWEKEGVKKEFFYYLDDTMIPKFERLEKQAGFRILVCRNSGRPYKITLLRPSRRLWDRQEAEQVVHAVPVSRDAVRYYIEGNCLQVVSAEADKANGVMTLCRWMGIPVKEMVAVGDSEEDRGMMML